MLKQRWQLAWHFYRQACAHQRLLSWVQGILLVFILLLSQTSASIQAYLEKDLEDAILRELENFLLELGAGFTFMARQKRIQIDNDDFYIDLLFYNRRLKRLVAIDLKLGDFKAADKPQVAQGCLLEVVLKRE
jgi:hypothetical protein